MPTLDVTVTTDWVDIKSTLSLTQGSTYKIDNVIGGPIYFRKGASTPALLIGHELYEKESDEVTIGTDGLWVRADGQNSKIVVTALEEISVLAETGAGIIGTSVAPTTTRTLEDGVIVTSIKIDLTGLASVATANDAIGLAAGGVSFIGRNVVANNGVVFKTEFSCIETPVGGDLEVNVVTNASGIIEYDGAAGTAYISDSGALTAGKTIQNLVPALTADHYFYLAGGAGDKAAAYTAGQFLLKLYGHAILA